MNSRDENYPIDDANELYIYTGIGRGGETTNFVDLIERIEDHFGKDISLSDLDITSEYRHTRSIYYDLYDGSDYDTYIIITRK